MATNHPCRCAAPTTLVCAGVLHRACNHLSASQYLEYRLTPRNSRFLVLHLSYEGMMPPSEVLRADTLFTRVRGRGVFGSTSREF